MTEKFKPKYREETVKKPRDPRDSLSHIPHSDLGFDSESFNQNQTGEFYPLNEDSVLEPSNDDTDSTLHEGDTLDEKPSFFEEKALELARNIGDCPYEIKKTILGLIKESLTPEELNGDINQTFDIVAAEYPTIDNTFSTDSNFDRYAQAHNWLDSINHIPDRILATKALILHGILLVDRDLAIEIAQLLNKRFGNLMVSGASREEEK